MGRYCAAGNLSDESMGDREGFVWMVGVEYVGLNLRIFESTISEGCCSRIDISLRYGAIRDLETSPIRRRGFAELLSLR